MTVLAKYQRLEAEGIWHPDPDAQRRDVIVSIGEATLVLSAMNGSALTHWSLPAIERLNPGERPALFSPGADAPETLELADPTMIDAIGKVLQAVERQRARPGRLRGLGVGSISLVVLALVVFWLPGAVTRYTASIVPDAARAAIGRDLLAQVRRVAGAPCAEASGLRALARVEARLFPSGTTRLVVLPSALAETAHLPGGTLLVSHRLVEDFETPEVLAGYLLAEDLRRRARDPIGRLLDHAGLSAAFSLLTTGHVPPATLANYAETLVAATPEPVPDAALLTRMAEAGVASAPYAFARDISGETTLPLIEVAEMEAQTMPILNDGNWIALQKICEN